MRILPSGPEHLSQHLSRLQEATGRELPWLHGVVEQLHDWAGQREAVLRLSLDPQADVLWARKEAMPVTPRPYFLWPQPHPLPRIDLPRRKGLHGRWEGPVLAAARAAGAADALLLWEDGTLAETAIATLAVERGSELILPPAGGRVRGLGERLLLPAWAEGEGLSLREDVVTFEEARKGRLWCVNAVRGIWEAELHPKAPSADGNP